MQYFYKYWILAFVFTALIMTAATAVEMVPANVLDLEVKNNHVVSLLVEMRLGRKNFEKRLIKCRRYPIRKVIFNGEFVKRTRVSCDYIKLNEIGRVNLIFNDDKKLQAIDIIVEKEDRLRNSISFH